MMTKKTSYYPIVLASVLSLSLGACSSTTVSNTPVAFQNKVQLVESVERLELYSRPEGLILSARDKVAVDQFLGAYRQGGDGPIYINIPNSTNMQRGVDQAEAIIRQNLPGANIQAGRYETAEGKPAPVIVSFRVLKTLPQDCRTMGNIVDTYSNQAYANFGCFHTANLAAMVRDPHQFIEPYPLSPPDSQRRSTVYEKYIEGTNPASEQPSRQDISVED